MLDVTPLLETDSIYINLSLRGGPGFHWSIFVPTNKPEGEVWHAVNRTGGWSLEVENATGVLNLPELCVLLKLGTVKSENWETLRTTLANVPGNGQPSPNTGEEFTCRVWVKDAILALHSSGVICLMKSIKKIEEDALVNREANREYIEHGTGSPMVINSTKFSTIV